eukprot:690488_1
MSTNPRNPPPKRRIRKHPKYFNLDQEEDVTLTQFYPVNRTTNNPSQKRNNAKQPSVKRIKASDESRVDVDGFDRGDSSPLFSRKRRKRKAPIHYSSSISQQQVQSNNSNNPNNKQARETTQLASQHRMYPLNPYFLMAWGPTWKRRTEIRLINEMPTDVTSPDDSEDIEAPPCASRPLRGIIKPSTPQVHQSSDHIDMVQVPDDDGEEKKNHSKEEMEYDEADLADDEIDDDDDDVNVLNNNRRKTDNDNNLSNHSDDRLLINTVDDVIKQQNNTRGWKTKNRKHHSLVIAGLESQFKAMHLDHTMFGDAIDMFSRMCYDYFSLYVNSKVAVHRTFKLIVTYEYPWHAHLQFRVNTAIKISNKKYFNIPREFIISWLHIYEDKLHYWMCNKCDELCQIDLQTYKKTLDESEYYDDYDIDVHNTIESRRDTLYVWMCQNTKWIDDADRYLWYMTKTGNHQIQNLIDKSKGCVLGDMIDYNVVDVQKDIDSYVLRKGKRGASKKPGVFKRISKRLADCVGESSLEEEIINVVRDDGDMVLMRNG